ncbi:DUF87 domain-containing protein [Candidatus Dojkabacteria bacterium]|nr:DUF87 domain-containing protein [Candidatus Dojkabacteria bacterium]
MTLQDIIAPIDMEIDFNDIKIGDRYHRSFFVSEYPRFVGPNWLSPIINFEYSINISTFYYPVDTKNILQKLKRKIGELEATLYTQMEKRQVIDPSTKVALSDAQKLQDSIAEGSEKFFHYAMYISVAANSKKELEKVSKNIISSLAAINVTAKTATLQQEEGFVACQPLGIDPIYITRNMDTTSLATTFPFVTSELTMDHGIMYGINQHNRSLVIFDRFDLENFNTVVFAKSGAGKSYFVKLEAIRSHMFGTNIIIIDPEHEYERLSDAVNGAYISFSQDKGHKINPFELSGLGDPNDDELREKILSLEGFLRLLMGGKLTSIELAILDRALILTYREKGITLDPATQRNKKPPLLEDLYKVLKGMAEPEARNMAGKLERYIIGSAAGIFNEPSTVEITNPFIVFSVRDLQEELRPMGMYLILDFIWTRIRKDKKKRILLVDEAWYMMQAPDSAKFLYSMVKRARKYYLGVTTITQDVEDFLQNELGRAIINNSSLSFLMKQSPNAIDKVGDVFNLSEGEKSFLLSCDRGQGLFFAGRNHVAIQVISSKAEHDLITTAPEDLERIKEEQATGVREKPLSELAEMYEPPVMLNAIDDREDSATEVKEAIKKRKSTVADLEEDRRAYEEKKKELDAAAQGKQADSAGNNVVNQMSDKYNELPESISQEVVNNRNELGKGSSHLTPQGIVDED